MNRIGSVSNENSFMRALSEYVASNPGAATYNKGIINSYVTELNIYHKPDPDDSQRKNISEMISKMKHADSEEERGSLQGKMKEVVNEIINNMSTIRSNTFVIHNERTKDVYGTLADNYTTNDRDNYIKGLVNLHEIISEVNQLASTPSFYHSKNPSVKKPYMTFIQTISQFKNILDITSFHLHHSTALYGDLLALFMIMAESSLNPKIPRMVPYFSHNMSTVIV